MNKRINFLALVFIIASIIAILAMTFIAGVGGKYLKDSKYDTRTIRSYEIVKRGNIYDRNGELINSTDYVDGKYIRKYNYPSLYAHAIGYMDKKYGTTAIEKTFDDVLQGRGSASTRTKLLNKIYKEKEGDHLIISIDHNLQKIAKEALGKESGAVVVTDPNSGEVLAYYSSPTFDEKDIELENNSESSGLLDRVKNARYTPGSVFKIITALDMLENNYNEKIIDKGVVKIGEGTISNAGGIRYGEIGLKEAFMHSTNTYFAEYAYKNIDSLVETTNIISDLISASCNSFGFKIEKGNDFSNAIAGIGQGKITASPLAINMITQAVYNGGYFYQPKMVSYSWSRDFKVRKEYKSNKVKLPFEKKHFELIKEMMIEVVDSGTAKGYGLKKSGGKTGTAELANNKYNYWFTGFSDENNPKIITVVVDNVSYSGYNKAIEIFKKISKQNIVN